eukprot:TRINITY_DN9_c1_g1_i3.p2 TRINITY_DN9_c1_g1~~TRINITY_DN9_c1_g1_i3.p2  ORF type:complete len:106 (+),score=34.66 TRINITY_DN9_c1_g1_i3:2-319(+)
MKPKKLQKTPEDKAAAKEITKRRNNLTNRAKDFFFKIKTINAGLGDIPKTDSEEDSLQSFIDEFNTRYKYKVTKDDWPTENGKVVKRNAMKLVAKLLINSFYDII